MATLEAAGPALEAKKAALERDVGSLTELVTALRQEAEELSRALPETRRQRQAEHQAALRDLDSQHQDELAEKRRTHAATLTFLSDERRAAENELAKTRAALKEARETLTALSQRITTDADS
jgi:chromosome segregation ATPase